jgi:dipeptidyl aminopeptidase/acylaminoacyl peptidase
MTVLARIFGVIAICAPVGLLAQTATLPPVQLFAPGVVSGPANDGSPTFSPDGKTLFFTRYAAHWSVILESHLKNGKWSEPVVAPFSGQWPDSSPTWSPDGKYLIFVSTRPKTPLKDVPKPGEPIPGIASNLWRVDKTSAGWSEPARLPDEVNITDAIFKPSVAANGDVFLTVIGPDTAKSIYVSPLRNGSYQRATILPFSDGAKLDVDPEVAPDESFLVFSSGGRVDGDPHERLFLVKREGDHWGSPTMIRYQNDVTKYGASTDNEPKLGRDRMTLYFSSDRTEATHFPRTRAQAETDLERLNRWDNSNSNIWMINLKGLI